MNRNRRWEQWEVCTKWYCIAVPFGAYVSINGTFCVKIFQSSAVPQCNFVFTRAFGFKAVGF
jgi:hypothetical protein